MRRVPNALTILRLALVPVVAWAVLRGDSTLAVVLFIGASLTDGFDGWLARRLNAESRFGKLADPVADKLLLSAILVCLWIHGAAPGWFVALVFGRDAMILGFAAYAFAFTPLRDFPPSIWGKLSTVAQMVAAVALLVGVLDWLDPILIAAAAAATAWSGMHYGVTGLRRITQNPPHPS